MSSVFFRHNNPAAELIHQIIVQTARDANVSVFLVGGTVRDMLLPMTPSNDNALPSSSMSIDMNIDMDYVPFGAGTDYQQFAELVSRKLRTRGVQFKDNTRLNITPSKQKALLANARATATATTTPSRASITITITIDISQPRGKTIAEDLQARDFTINNLALSMTGEIIGDPRHISEGTICAVSPNTFPDDPLRILRAYRFQATLGFTIAPQTHADLMQHKHLLAGIPSERVLKELRSIFASHNPTFMAQGLAAMGQDAIAPLILDNATINTETLQHITRNSCKHCNANGANADVGNDTTHCLWHQLEGNPHRFEVLFASVFDFPTTSTLNAQTGTQTGTQTVAKTLRNASLPNSEQRLIRTLHQLCVANDHPLTLETVWQNYSIISAVEWGLRLRNKSDNLKHLRQTLSTINRERGLQLTGDTLICAGFKPSKGFSDILLQGQTTLATTALSVDEVVAQLLQGNSSQGNSSQGA